MEKIIHGRDINAFMGILYKKCKHLTRNRHLTKYSLRPHPAKLNTEAGK